MIRFKKIIYFFSLLLLLPSCNDSIEGRWVFSSAEVNYSVDTTQTMIDIVDLKSFIELPTNDTLICTENGLLSTSEKSFTGIWYYDDSYLWFDVEWGELFNDLYMGRGEIIRFKVVEIDDNNLKLLLENNAGKSNITFAK